MAKGQTQNYFHIIAKRAAEMAGNPVAFTLAVIFVLLWLLAGEVYKFSDTWQLVINSITNIIEFLLLFLIQNTQNRDAEYFNIKLDELLRANRTSRKSIINLDNLTDEQLKILENEYIKLSKN